MLVNEQLVSKRQFLQCSMNDYLRSVPIKSIVNKGRNRRRMGNWLVRDTWDTKASGN